MTPGVHGRLLTSSFIRDLLPQLAPESPPPAFGRALESWWDRTEAALGPASSIRAITEGAALPLLRLLDLTVTGRADVKGVCLLHTSWSGHRGPDVVVTGWNQPLSPVWRTAVVEAIALDGRWAFCTNGTALRLVDARRTWTRDYLEIDLALAAHHPEPVALLWTFARGAAITNGRLLDLAVEQSARYGVDVCRALGTGVLDALAALLDAFVTSSGGRRRRVRIGRHEAFELATTILYRMLFLLFAEARGLVPMWHAVYRDHYSLDASVRALVDGRSSRGLWQAVQAISRLAGSGCRAGELKVNAFNGRLFSPADIAALDRLPITDTAMASALISVATRPVQPMRSGNPASTSGSDRPARQRILYRDLDVEQLGAVYERTLDYEPRPPHAGSGSSQTGSRTAVLARTRDVRKASAAFYTPRAVAACVVRDTLAPLVTGRTAEQILGLRILDPAMGSGAFLVAACRYLAAAVEDALIREGRWHAGDVMPSDRIDIRREVASRCLFGVDLNPMAVQLARLSLWLATLAADKPLSFLDHHLVTGDSLLGATPDDVRRGASKTPGRPSRHEPLPLFDGDAHGPALEDAVRIRLALSLQPDDTARIVREKERALAGLRSEGGAIARWTRALDLWCARWFWPEGTPPDRRTCADAIQAVLRGRSALPASAVAPVIEQSEIVAAACRFLHWPLVFPEVFAGDPGSPSAGPGFDAVIGNPPWDMVKGDSGSDEVRRARRELAGRLTGFVRESGIYRVASRTHVNRYQLFVERALQLVRPGGRIGLVVPSGLVSDAGAAALRRHLFDRADVDSITGFDNRNAIFPIHRSVRFALITCTRGRPTTAMACRFGLSSVDDLDDRRSGRHGPLLVTRRLLARVSGEEDLGVPEVATELDLRIVDRVTARLPRLSSENGWNARFGRELNATDDRTSFRRASGDRHARPVVEGKHIDAFRAATDGCQYELRPGAAAGRRAGSTPRLAYRDVASATNRLTLIAAIVPGRAVTTHTLFCLKTPLTLDAQQVLCALLNSFVANYLVRLRVHTHVTVSLVSRLPIPFLRPDDGRFTQLVRLSRALAASSAPVEEMPEYAELQAAVALLYDLTEDEFAHVLSTFPLVREEARRDSLARFTR